MENRSYGLWTVVISEKDSEKPSSVVMSRTKSAEVRVVHAYVFRPSKIGRKVGTALDPTYPPL